MPNPPPENLRRRDPKVKYLNLRDTEVTIDVYFDHILDQNKAWSSKKKLALVIQHDGHGYLRPAIFSGSIPDVVKSNPDITDITDASHTQAMDSYKYHRAPRDAEEDLFDVDLPCSTINRSSRYDLHANPSPPCRPETSAAPAISPRRDPNRHCVRRSASPLVKPDAPPRKKPFVYKKQNYDRASSPLKTTSTSRPKDLKSASEAQLAARVHHQQLVTDNADSEAIATAQAAVDDSDRHHLRVLRTYVDAPLGKPKPLPVEPFLISADPPVCVDSGATETVFSKTFFTNHSESAINCDSSAVDSDSSEMPVCTHS